MRPGASRQAGWLIASAALLLAASAADAAPSRHRISGVNVLEPLRAVGTEPFWSVEVARAGIAWSDPETAPLRGSYRKPRLTAGRAVWRTRISDGSTLTVTITAGPCDDGMSDRIYPLTAQVRFGQRVYQGCAATIRAMDEARGRSDGEIR